MPSGAIPEWPWRSRIGIDPGEVHPLWRAFLRRTVRAGRTGVLPGVNPPPERRGIAETSYSQIDENSPPPRRGLMLPRRLTASEPGWTLDTDIVVIGSGIAGLVAALRARTAGRVLLVTKALLDDGSTRWAQGGIAAALHPGDSPEEHLTDTLTAGVGVCDPEAVRVLVTEGPDAVGRLIEIGADYDRDGDGGLALTREGGHLKRRIAHAGGDATGAEISRALLAATKDAGIEVIELALALDLLVEAGRARGVTLHVMGE